MDEAIKDLKAEKHPVALAAWEALQVHLQATSRTLKTRGQLHWMLDHLEALARRGVVLNRDIPSHEVLASILGVSQQLVSEFAKDRDKGRLRAERLKVRKLGEAPRTQAQVSKAADRSEIKAYLPIGLAALWGLLKSITNYGCSQPLRNRSKVTSQDSPRPHTTPLFILS